MPLRAHWIDRQTIALPARDTLPDSVCRLETTSGHLKLTRVPGLTASQSEKYPQLKSYAIFHLPADLSAETLQAALKGPLQVTCNSGSYSTGVQTAGVLDDLFFFNGKLGPQFADLHENIRVGVWAPTAQSVQLLLFKAQTDSEPADIISMLEANGVWTAEIEPSWRDSYYLFRVKVFVPALNRVIENLVTDPYSPDLALNGAKSRLTDLRAGRTKPSGWDQHRSPDIPSVSDLTIWELHVREFSASDQSVPPEKRGTYLAFTCTESNGMQHLSRLVNSGLKAIHLLPTFHIASVNEDKNLWQSPGDLSNYPPDGTHQQAAVAAVKNFDAYNWGYDPVHYMAPEGSYTHNPDDRVKEYRAMVQALHSAGLRVIQDLVFNHTDAAGQDQNSVLDKIVPNYYYRLDGDGQIYKNSCCPDTASEHRMMEKLMIDSILRSAREYKIDGFRFDLMGFHFVYNLRHIQEALATLTLENDGVDGTKIYLYGEGWTTGETANNALGPNASQPNLHGIGVGTFNDRIRDAIRGGSPFGDMRTQGFATGLYTSSSDFTNQAASRDEQLNQLLAESDWLRAGLGGNPRDFTFTGSRGEPVSAGALDYGGRPAGYTASPLECINYCSVHDNQNLFDAIQLKSPAGDSPRTRAKRQILAMSLIALAQGIPFFYSGDEILRSKDMDNNSFNSGDWFNKLDFTYQSNNWGVGLPMASENGANWHLMQPLLANSALKPSREDILFTRHCFEEYLRIRTSSQLFRMPTLAEVQRNLTFLPSEPGVIAMHLSANGGKYSGYQQILTIFNATIHHVSFAHESLKGSPLRLHPALKDAGAFDAITGTATVPPLTTAVFVRS